METSDAQPSASWSGSVEEGGDHRVLPKHAKPKLGPYVA